MRSTQPRSRHLPQTSIGLSSPLLEHSAGCCPGLPHCDAFSLSSRALDRPIIQRGPAVGMPHQAANSCGSPAQVPILLHWQLSLPKLKCHVEAKASQAPCIRPAQLLLGSVALGSLLPNEVEGPGLPRQHPRVNARGHDPPEHPPPQPVAAWTPPSCSAAAPEAWPAQEVRNCVTTTQYINRSYVLVSTNTSHMPYVSRRLGPPAPCPAIAPAACPA